MPTWAHSHICSFYGHTLAAFPPHPQIRLPKLAVRCGKVSCLVRVWTLECLERYIHVCVFLLVDRVDLWRKSLQLQSEGGAEANSINSAGIGIFDTQAAPTRSLHMNNGLWAVAVCSACICHLPISAPASSALYSFPWGNLPRTSAGCTSRGQIKPTSPQCSSGLIHGLQEPQERNDSHRDSPTSAPEAPPEDFKASELLRFLWL